MAKSVNALVGQAIRDHRERATLTVQQASRIVGITIEAMTSIEGGEKQASPQVLEALAAAFDVPISAFMEQVLKAPAIKAEDKPGSLPAGKRRK